MKTIIIGCGATMENGFGGPIRYKRGQFDGRGCYPHALHTHPNCTTVDIDPACSPSIVLNFATPDLAKLVRKIGNEKFDLIVLETLPDCIYNMAKYFGNIIRNCNYISTEIGQVFIPFINDENAQLLSIYFPFYGYKLIHKSHDFSLIYPIISAITGGNAYEYMMRYRLQIIKKEKYHIYQNYFLFKR